MVANTPPRPLLDDPSSLFSPAPYTKKLFYFGETLNPQQKKPPLLKNFSKHQEIFNQPMLIASTLLP